MIYTCMHCSKTFNQKSHYTAHLNKKFPCKKCDKNFETQWMYINNKCINISEYEKSFKKEIPRCKFGHELVFCNGSKIKSYFRHKYEKDTWSSGMSKFHLTWQGRFKDTEIRFPKINESQIKDRNADVVLNDNYILEIQHSHISEKEVLDRYHDYELHNKKIIWLLDGNTEDVECNKLSDGTYLIQFKQSWKYKSFVHKYEFILLDTNDQIFKIPVRQICTTKMVKVVSSKSIDDILNTFNDNPETIWRIWPQSNIIKPKLTVRQKGAGNGKTYGIWKSISENRDPRIIYAICKITCSERGYLQRIKRSI